MTNPEIRMAAHISRRDAAHPQVPQTVRGMILGVSTTITPLSRPDVVYGLLPCFAIPLGELTQPRGMER